MTAVDLDDIRDRAVITVTEAAELLGLDQRSVRRGIQEGNLPGIKVGRRILIPVPKLLAMLDVPDDAPRPLTAGELIGYLSLDTIDEAD